MCKSTFVSKFTSLVLFKKLALNSFVVSSSSLILVKTSSKTTSTSSLIWSSLKLLSVIRRKFLEFHLLTLMFSSLHIITTINVILQFVSILYLLRIYRIIWLSQFFITVSKMAFVSQRTVFVGFIMSTSFSLILVIQLICRLLIRHF